MSNPKLLFIIMYFLSVLFAYMLKRIIYNIAIKAIKDEKLETGIYTLFPVEGKKAVELAKGYIRGANIIYWFILIIFPIGLIILFLHHAI